MSAADQIEEAPEVVLRYQGGLRAAWQDLTEGARQWPLWWLLALQQVKSQYRRTVLGPWWMTIQMAAFVAALSLLFGALMGRDMQTFVPYVAVGYVFFSFLSGTFISGSTAFTANAGTIKGSPAPLSTFVYRGVAVNLIQLAHDFVVVVIILIVFRVTPTWELVLFPLGLLFVVVNAVAFGLWLGPLTARYRDVGQVVQALVRILFFLTPIFWNPSDLSSQQRALLAAWNPFAYLLAIVRSPLLGMPVEMLVVLGTLVVTVLNVVGGFFGFAASRRSVPYWVQS
ncbi:MAG: ABC transporter permease [Candidatus Nanopelagicales bacterium]